jgi:tetratricopeptide (TPR) repeat protein
MILTACLVSLPAHGFMFQPDKLDIYLLPEHCQMKLADFGNNRDGSWPVRIPVNEKRIAYWRGLIGPDWRHMHHYCAGLALLALARDPARLERRNRSASFIYRQASAEMNYTISRSNSRQPLWIEMNMNQAKALAGQGKVNDAVDKLTKLIALAPANQDLYVTLAKMEHRRGKVEEAVAILEAGLERAKVKGPILFYLARYTYDMGDVQRAAELTLRAEKAGMKMDSLREKLGSAIAPAAGPGAATAASD